MLSAYRALDLTDETGFLCGKVLGDLGADVIKVEKPGGDTSRNVGPYYKDISDPEKSLFWWAYNTSKRGITLDIEEEAGKKIFRQLVEEVDFVIETYPPGHLDKLNLGYQDLRKINPKLIMGSITPFGQTGPYKDYKATDIIAMAMSGLMYLQGDTDRPPIRFSFPQSYLHAGAQCAIGIIIALYHREVTSGRGQHVDIALRDSVIMATLNAVPFWELDQTNLKRAGDFRVGLSSGIRQRQNWPCKDGYVSFITMGGAHGAKTNKALVEWLKTEGEKDEFLHQIDWDNFDMGASTQEIHDHMEKIVGKFFMRFTKKEIHDQAVKRQMMLFPVNTMKDIAENEQLKFRGFWQELEHPELDTSITYPGSFVLDAEPPLSLRRRAPLIGEHNEEIYLKELGFSREQFETLKQAKVI